MRCFTTVITLILGIATCIAATPWEYTTAAMNYRPYPVGSTVLNDTLDIPDGYRLYSLQHYGRHGSRFHTDYVRQDNLIDLLTNNSRTATGDSLLADILRRRMAMENRLGELTPLGAEQHRGIARRMVRSAPGLFTPDTKLDAKSSFTVRCILSMANALTQICNDAPGIVPTLDASRADVLITRNERGDAENVNRGSVAQALKDYRDANSSGTAWLGRLLTPGYEGITPQKADSLADFLHEIMANATSEEILMAERDVFTAAEIEANHKRLNAAWFAYAGNYAPLKGQRMAYSAELLKDIIDKADNAVNDTVPHVDLRFGHESMLLPLLALMDVNGYGKGFQTLSDIDGKWDAGCVFPMAANLQLFFARPIKGNGPVLVKILLNEEPVTLPVRSRADGWTDWKRLKDHYLKVSGKKS